jgi:hypothetical protein
MGQIATSLYRKFESNRSKGLEAYSELLNLNKGSGSPSRRVSKGRVTCSSPLYTIFGHFTLEPSEYTSIFPSGIISHYTENGNHYIYNHSLYHGV